MNWNIMKWNGKIGGEMWPKMEFNLSHPFTSQALWNYWSASNSQEIFIN